MMNNGLAEWYIEGDVITPDGKLSLRDQAVGEYAKYVTIEKIDNLAMCFFNLPYNRESIDEFINILKKHDNTFSLQALEELKILAGAVLNHIVVNQETLCYYVELIVQSAKFNNSRAKISSLLNSIENEFIQDSLSLRRTDTKNRKILISTYDEIFNTENELKWDQSTLASFKIFMEEIKDGISILNEFVENMVKIQKLRTEESQLLWWMTNAWSSSVNQHYKNLEQYSASYFIPYELAELVQVFPGPYPIKSIIHNVLNSCKKNPAKNFFDYVQLTPEHIRDEIAKQFSDNNNKPLFPICMAIDASSNTTTPDEWKNKYIKESNLNELKSKKIPPLDFACQLYFELLAIKCAKD